MALASGETLGPYKIIALIGKGGMGEVYRAHDTRLNRDVAIKVSAAQFSERFEREAKAIAALNHPNICQIYDVGPNYLVMEMVEGSALKGPMPVAKALEYARQMLDALEAAHRKGITHRDLKPANILATTKSVKVLDFGLAKVDTKLKETDATLTQALTTEGQIAGTLQYMAPEQLQGKNADARSDLFSFGCVFYEMLSGRRAFGGENAASVIAAIMERTPAPLEIEPRLERVIQKCLAKDPDQRFQNALDLRTALEWAAEETTAGAEITAKKSVLRDWRWWLAAAVVLVAGAAGGWAISRGGSAPAADALVRFNWEPPSRSNFSESPGGSAISPDNSTIASVIRTNGVDELWLRRLDGDAPIRLAGTEGAAVPAFSPDGKSMVYATPEGIQRVELASGSRTQICAGDAPGGLAWTSDGTILVGSPAGLMQVPAAGGSLVPLTTADKPHERAHRYPQILPGGRLLYWAWGTNPADSAIYLTSLAQPAKRTKVLATTSKAIYAAGSLFWVRDRSLVTQTLDPESGKLSGEQRIVASGLTQSSSLTGNLLMAASPGVLVYSSSPPPLTQLVWRDRAGKQLGTVGEPITNISFRLSPGGRQAVVARGESGRVDRIEDIWLMDMERGVLTRLTSSGNNSQPVWSADGSSIIYTSGTPQRYLVRRDLQGSGAEQRLIEEKTIPFANDWSRDGWVVYDVNGAGTKNDILMFRIAPGLAIKPQPFLRTQFSEWEARFSTEPGQHWIAYRSDESGQDEIYVQRFPEGGLKTRVSAAGGRFAEWGPGGRELFYVAADKKLMVADVKLGANAVEVSAPRELFEVPAYFNLAYPYHVSPDGQRFLVREIVDVSQAMSVVVNWNAGLKK